MNRWLTAVRWLGAVLGGCLPLVAAETEEKPRVRGAGSETGGRVYVIPIQGEITAPMAYVVRRGVKEALQAKADLLVLDMDTPGGSVQVTEEIIEILGRFKGESATYVNRKALSAGAYIAVGTKRIVMADEAVIGAATPMMILGGTPAQLPESVEAKMTSGIKGLVRATAQKNGHNADVLEAMIDRNKELVIDGKVINAKGQILTLTSVEASRTYGEPPRPLFSEGTYGTLEQALSGLGYGEAKPMRLAPSGAETVAFWLNAISPLLLALGLLGIYMEFKTPGFGVPGSIAVGALLLYFAGGYLAGLSGLEWVIVFVVGVILIALELLVFPGTLALGLTGLALVLIAIVMAAADVYPGEGWRFEMTSFQRPVRNLALAVCLTGLGGWLLTWILPKTAVDRVLVSQGASGQVTDAVRAREQLAQIGQEGVALTMLRPGGKARFGNATLDVVTTGGLVEKGERIRIVGHSTHEAVVEACGSRGEISAS